MAENKSKLMSILNNGKTHASVFWLVIAGLGVYLGWLSILGWKEVLEEGKWIPTDCRIIESGIGEEGGEDWQDIFVVRYQYQWKGEVFLCDRYQTGYAGGSAYDDPNELVSKYATGRTTTCYVNPENPEEAVLERESRLTMLFIILPAVLVITGLAHLARVWNPGLGECFRQSRGGRVFRFAWKPLEWIALGFAGLTFLSVGLIAVIGLVVVLFLFFGFPLLVASIFGTELAKFKKELMRFQIPDHDASDPMDAKARRLRLSHTEIIIVASGSTVLILIMAFYIKYNFALEMWSFFGVMFMTVWFGGLITFFTCGLLIRQRRHRYRNWRSKSASKKTTRPKHEEPIKVLKLTTECLGIIGIAGFLAGFVCSFISMADKPMVSTWARFPLGDLRDIAIDSEDNIYCALPFYSRIQVYSPEGEFLRGWFLDAGGGVFRIKFDEEDNLHVGTARGDNHYTFSRKGRLLSSEAMSPNKDKRIFGDRYYEPIDRGGGERFEVRGRMLFPRVVKTASDGTKTVVISDPFWLWFVKGPFPAFLHIVLFGFLFEIVRRYSYSRTTKKRPMTEVAKEDRSAAEEFEI